MKRRNTSGEKHAQRDRFEQAISKFAGMTPKQQQAILLLLGGSSVVDVARRVGITRRTLFQWRRSEKFINALESWRADMEQVTRSRLLNLSSMGLRAINRALEAGDAKVALAVFKGLGIFNPSPEPTTRDTVIYRREVDRGKADAEVE